MDLLDDEDYGSVSDEESLDDGLSGVTSGITSGIATESDILPSPSVSNLISDFHAQFWHQGADLDDLIQLAKHETIIRDATNHTTEPYNVIKLGQLMPLFDTELSMVFQCIVDTYKAKFPGLETIVPERKQYVDVVKMLQQDIPNVQLDQVLSKEETLVVSMSLKTDFKEGARIDKDLLSKAIHWFDILYNLRDNVSHYVETRIQMVAPNLCALLGPDTAAKLVTHCGSVKELSVVPSCNLASIGQDKTLHGKSLDISGVRQKGYLSYTDVVQTQPPEFQKQALRMVSAKVALAARADCTMGNQVINPDGNSDGNSDASKLGLKWRHEIVEKLKKIIDPPNISNIKPLPIPEDAPKKKRAGRRFRKYKEQFKMSHLRQMQNRMEFGKEEQTTMDPYGEEIGFGMADSKNVSALSSFNKTKMRKSMRLRLDQETKNTHSFLQDERSEKLKRSAEHPQATDPATSKQPRL